MCFSIFSRRDDFVELRGLTINVLYMSSNHSHCPLVRLTCEVVQFSTFRLSLSAESRLHVLLVFVVTHLADFILLFRIDGVERIGDDDKVSVEVCKYRWHLRQRASRSDSSSMTWVDGPVFISMTTCVQVSKNLRKGSR